MYFHIVEVASDMISIWVVEFWVLIHVEPDGERGDERDNGVCEEDEDCLARALGARLSWGGRQAKAQA
ncbi:hypothetical protein EV2_020661 [Malus domestica]